MADDCFGHPRLAAVYDQLDPDRSDLDAYLRRAQELRARQVLDIGCGTGVFALLLAGRGVDVVGVDPAQASVDSPGQTGQCDPARRAWEAWTREHSYRVTQIPGTGSVESWVQLIDVSRPLVSFRWTYIFAADGQVLTSDSTLRFRERDEVETDLVARGYVVRDVRDAPDRPGSEFVFLARRPDLGVQDT
ncbi:class I SAM-dependent methyltransferase [Streptomyces griseus]|uniref:class I SAM-dependent methyltransferase n=1 Tax=Streptomyces griseus TaxID=1911 RepID=UPI0033FE74A0